ncbi:hypothetical protein [Catenuloplanes japonicus]|uniref:hypothetical protein n=1 Tax=Catenuloplanes japonicus TaxID=33876 RepID=UPI00069209B1|nr:hypothetical protein [Catenuloplanes japonicus]
MDVGGVLVVLAGDDVDTSFFGVRPLETPAMPGAFARLAALTAGRFRGRVHLVSKAGPKVERNTRDWLHHHGFFARTGVPPENVHFVRERRDKAAVCATYGITHFVDDRADVLACLETVPHRYLMGGAEIPDWDALFRAVTRQPDLE